MTDSHHVCRLRSNCKALSGEWAHKLSPLTLVVGENGAGKSSIVAAYELALTGRTSDTGAVPSEILSLAPTGSDGVFASAEVSDGRSVDYRIVGTQAKAKKPEWTEPGPVAALLHREVADLLRSDPKRLRAALLRAATSDLDPAALLVPVPAAFHDLWNEIWSTARAASETDADALSSALSRIQSDIRAAKLAAPAPDEPDTESVPSEETVTRLQARVQELLQRQDGGAESILRDAARIQTAALSRHGVECPVCHQPISDTGLVAARDATEAALAGLRSRPPDPELEAASSELQAASEARSRAAARLEAARGATEARARIDVLKSLESSVHRIIETTLPAAISRFVDRANAALADEKVSVQLFDSGKSVCRIGLERSDGTTIGWRALPGAARARLIAALSCAWASTRREPIRSVIIDEVWLRSEALSQLCAGLARAVGTDGGPTQAIVCVADDYGLVPPGWSVVRVG